MWIVPEIMGPFLLNVVLRHLEFQGYQNEILILGTTHIKVMQVFVVSTVILVDDVNLSPL